MGKNVKFKDVITHCMVVKAIAQCHTCKEISAASGLSTSKIYKIAKDMGVRFKRNAKKKSKN